MKVVVQDRYLREWDIAGSLMPVEPSRYSL